MLGRWLVGGLAVVALIGSQPLVAQLQRPLTPLPPGGLRVAPFFDGWYENADGSFSFSLGYSNLNLTETIEIPIGPDNFIEPAEFNGKQPTTFYPGGGDQPAAGGRASTRRERERGVFTVNTPPGFRGEVVWTIRHAGQANRVPASNRTGAYQLRWPMAMGSTPPVIRFTPNGPTNRGPMGLDSPDVVQASVGKPVQLQAHLLDDADMEEDPLPTRRRSQEPAVMNVTWYKHQGPVGGKIEFEPRRDPIRTKEATASTMATFDMPGQYMVRVRADVFGRLDTSAGNQCCWTNGYIRVNVTP